MRTFWLLLVATLLSVSAVAQTAEQENRGADLGRFDRPNAPGTPPTPETAAVSQDFRLILTLPAYGTNNAIGADADATGQRNPPDGHVTPDLLLRWLHQYSFVRLAAGFDVSVDRFFIRSDQNSDSLYASFKAALTDGESDLLVPYVAYGGTLDFGPRLTQWNDTLHSFSVGFSSGIGLDADGRRIAFRDAIRPGDWSISVDIAIGHRLANPSDFANRFAVASVDILYNVNDTLRVGITPTIRARYYPNYFGAPRRDLRVGWYARAEWTPEWLARINPEAELDFTISFLRNRSNVASENYSQWEGGPALMLAWRF